MKSACKAEVVEVVGEVGEVPNPSWLQARRIWDNGSELAPIAQACCQSVAARTEPRSLASPGAFARFIPAPAPGACARTHSSRPAMVMSTEDENISAEYLGYLKPKPAAPVPQGRLAHWLAVWP